jgi:hypothetical protein
VSTPISIRLIDILERAARDAQVYDHYPAVYALIIAAQAVVKALRGQESEEAAPPHDEG